MRIPLSIHKVGVFVNEEPDTIVAIADKYGLEYIQLHGDEDLAFANALKERGQKIIKVFRVMDTIPVYARNYQGIADYFLFDTKGKYYGGNSLKFNWTLLKKYNGQTPYFLSGGIGPESKNEIEDFLKSPESSKCIAIDLNSKFEDVPGMKNIEKLKKFKEAMQ